MIALFLLPSISVARFTRTIPYSVAAAVDAPCLYVEKRFSMGLLLILILVILLMGAWPAWPHSKNWGYFPSGGLGLVLLIVIVLIVLGRI